MDSLIGLIGSSTASHGATIGLIVFVIWRLGKMNGSVRELKAWADAHAEFDKTMFGQLQNTDDAQWKAIEKLRDRT